MWPFEIKEVSNGAYACTGKRTTDNIVKITCGEDEIYRVFEEAFKLEVAFGTHPSKALFQVVSGSKPYWDAKYEEKVFGSWVVENSTNTNRYVFDGKDSFLMIYEGGEQPSWQSHFKTGEDVSREFLNKLVS